MGREPEVPFATVLSSLFEAEKPPLDMLYRLSDLSAAEWEQFVASWANVPEERRRIIMRHMADISEENFVVDFVPVFTHAFRDPEAAVREAALDGVWDATNTNLVPIIIEMMEEDESVVVRAAAARALAHYVLMAEWGQLPADISPPIVAALLHAYDQPETAVPVKRAALEAVSSANHPRVATLIEEAYESDNFEMQLSAVFAMGGTADSRWLPTVIAEFEHPDAGMRAEAARAAGSIGGSDTIPPLAELIGDEDLEVALAAVNALGQIGGNQVAEILDDVLADPELDALHETAADVLEEMTWLDGELMLFSLPPENETDDDLPLI